MSIVDNSSRFSKLFKDFLSFPRSSFSEALILSISLTYEFCLYQCVREEKEDLNHFTNKLNFWNHTPSPHIDSALTPSLACIYFNYVLIDFWAVKIKGRMRASLFLLKSQQRKQARYIMVSTRVAQLDARINYKLHFTNVKKFILDRKYHLTDRKWIPYTYSNKLFSAFLVVTYDPIDTHCVAIQTRRKVRQRFRIAKCHKKHPFSTLYFAQFW